MSNITFLDKDGVMEFADGKVQHIRGNYHLAELPAGDWHMTVCGGAVVFADRSGQSPAMSVDREGNWTVIEPSDKPVTFVQSRVTIGAVK